MKLTTIFLSVILLSSTILAVMPEQEAFAVSTPPESSNASIKTDKSIYLFGEDIIISGNITIDSEQQTPDMDSEEPYLNIFIYKQNDDNFFAIISFVSINSDGSFSRTFKAIDPSWATGDYTLIADYNYSDVASTEFEFKIPPSEIISDIFVTYDFDKKSLQVEWLPFDGSCIFGFYVDYYDLKDNKIIPTKLPSSLHFPLSCDIGTFTIDMKEYDVYPDIDFNSVMWYIPDPSVPWQALFVKESKFSDICKERIYDKVLLTTGYNQVYSSESFRYSNDGVSREGLNPFFNIFTISNEDADDVLFYSTYIDVGYVNFLTIDHNSPNVTPHESVSLDSDHYSFDPVTCALQETKNNSNNCPDCEPPTLGINIDGIKLVDNGFTYNDQSTDAEFFYTPFPLIEASIGKVNRVELVIFENSGIHNIQWIDLLLGTQVGKPASESEAIIHLELENKEITNLEITDPQNLIDASVIVDVQSYPCSSTNNEVCLKVGLEYSYREAPLYNAVGVQLADIERNTQIHYFNEGVNVTGESLNEAPTYLMFTKQSNQQKDMFLLLTQIDRASDIWTDTNDIKYQKISEDRFERITPHAEFVCDDTPLDEIKVPTRNNCNFREQMGWLWQN